MATAKSSEEKVDVPDVLWVGVRGGKGQDTDPVLLMARRDPEAFRLKVRMLTGLFIM